MISNLPGIRLNFGGDIVREIQSEPKPKPQVLEFDPPFIVTVLNSHRNWARMCEVEEFTEAVAAASHYADILGEHRVKLLDSAHRVLG
ncbi:MAG: hypothetical protein ACI9R3_004927 [Verrucomicrobiales bacterium]